MHRRLSRLAVLTAIALGLAGLSSAPAEAATGMLSGVVHGPDGRVVSTCVQAFAVTDHGYQAAGGACTDATGSWRIRGLAAEVGYKVSIDGTGNLAPQFADHKTSVYDADVYSVGSTISKTLDPDATFSGRLVDSQGNGVEASVRVRNLNTP